MPNIHPLKMGVDRVGPTMHEEETRVADLIATVENYIPAFAAGIARASAEKDSPFMLHQDAFAAGYDYDEYTLLGMAIKYAGLKGVTVTVVGKNDATF